MEWIKCSERLPKINQHVLCFDPSHSEAKIYIVKLEKENFYEIDNCKLGHPQHFIESAGESYFTWKPTHWMPLPNPPNEGDEILQKILDVECEDMKKQKWLNSPILPLPNPPEE